uniref:Interleukin 20 receptor subunit alpha n=1 Tax=Leptobrachium leishanense TaxID=445787 RepID=A0A8C5WIS2_9ANUR
KKTSKRNCSLPKPGNVYFSSENARHILKWTAPNITEPVLYTVKYFIYGSSGADRWKNKSECENISRTWCDLSNETSEYTEQYVAKVFVIGKCCCPSKDSTRFHPSPHIFPPKLELISGTKSFVINVSYPSDQQTFKDPVYQITIRDTRTQRAWQTHKLLHENLDPNTTYCVTAKVYIARLLKYSSPSTDVCVTTPEDFSSEEAVRVVTSIVFPALLCILCALAIGYHVFKYIYVAGLTQPQILNLTAGRNKIRTLHVETHVTFNIIRLIDTITLKKMEENKNADTNTEEEIEKHITNNIKATTDYCIDDLDYVTLQASTSQEIKPDFDKPTITTNIKAYDMPHHPLEPQPPLQPLEPLGSMDCRVEYGRIKTICRSYQAKQISESGIANTKYMVEKPSATINSYIPKTIEDSVQKVHANTECVQELTDKNLITSNHVVNNWTHVVPGIHLPNVFNTTAELDYAESTQDVKEGLLSRLYMPFGFEEPSEENELLQLERRWELHVHMPE